MAEFTPSKKTAQDFNNGIEYVDYDADDGTMGDAVQAETINNLVESALYTQEQAETAAAEASEALNKINGAISTNVVPNGSYPNMSVGSATNAENSTNDGNGDNIAETYVKFSDIERLILEHEYPVGGSKRYVQYPGMESPGDRWAGTSWEIDTTMQGRTLIGSGGSFTFGATGGEETHTLTTNEMPSHSHGVPAFTDGPGFISAAANAKNTNNQFDFNTYSNGGDQPHNNMPPYLVANYWKRKA